MYGKADFLVNTLAYFGKIPGLQKIKEKSKKLLERRKLFDFPKYSFM